MESPSCLFDVILILSDLGESRSEVVCFGLGRRSYGPALIKSDLKKGLCAHDTTRSIAIG